MVGALLLLFNGMLLMLVIFNQNHFLEGQYWYYFTHSCCKKEIQTFPKGNIPKMNAT